MNVQYRAFHGPSDWGWITEHNPINRCEDTCGIMAFDADTYLTVGAFMMDNWTANSVQCHFMLANPMVLKHGFLELCADYVYNERNVANVYALVPANNVKAVKLNKHMGYTIIACLEEAFEIGVDYLLMGMKRDDCVFYKKREKAAQPSRSDRLFYRKPNPPPIHPVPTPPSPRRRPSASPPAKGCGPGPVL